MPWMERSAMDQRVAFFADSDTNSDGAAHARRRSVREQRDHGERCAWHRKNAKDHGKLGPPMLCGEQRKLLARERHIRGHRRHRESCHCRAQPSSALTSRLCWRVHAHGSVLGIAMRRTSARVPDENQTAILLRRSVGTAPLVVLRGRPPFAPLARAAAALAGDVA